MIDVIADAKKSFFDQTKVIRVMDAKTRRVLMKAGAYIRRTMQTSMRSRAGSSPPGQPPHSHGQKLLRKFIFFTYDASIKTMVVGPVLLQRYAYRKVPSLLDKGGTIVDRVRGNPIQKNYRPRPFSKPAFDKHIPMIAKMFAET